MESLNRQVGKIESDIAKAGQEIISAKNLDAESEDYALAVAQIQWKLDALSGSVAQLDAGLRAQPREVAERIKEVLENRLSPRIEEQKFAFEKLKVDAHKWARKDFYEALGVSRTADENAIRAAQRAKTRQFHPDAPGGGDPDKFREVDEAYKVLRDPVSKAEYDELLLEKANLAEGFKPKAKPAPRPSPGPTTGPAAPPRPSPGPTATGPAAAPAAPARAPRAPAGLRGWAALSAASSPAENLRIIKETPWLLTRIGQGSFRKHFGEQAVAERWETIQELVRQAKADKDEAVAASIAASVAEQVEELRAAAAAAPAAPAPGALPSGPGAWRGYGVDVLDGRRQRPDGSWEREVRNAAGARMFVPENELYAGVPGTPPPVPPSPPRPGAPTPPGAPHAPRAPRTTPEFRAEMERLRAEFFAEQARQLADYRKGGSFFRRTLRLNKVREALGISHKEEWTPSAAAAKAAYEQARIAYGNARKAELIAAAGGKVEELARIQATLFKELVVDERLLQEQNNATSFPARERSLWLKSLQWYAKQPWWIKASVSTAVITGVTSATFGLGGAGATFLYAAGRLGRAVVGGAVGTAAAKGVGMLWDRRIKFTKEAGVAAAERTFTINNLADVESAYKKTYDKEARQRLWKLASQAAAGIAVGASTSLLLPSPGAAAELKMPVTREDDVMRLYPTPEADKIDPSFPAPPAERGEIPGLYKPLPEPPPAAPPPVAPEVAPEAPKGRAPEPAVPEKDIHPALAGMPDEVEVKRGDGWSMILDREFKKSGVYQEMTFQQRKNLVYGIINAYGLEGRMIHPGALRLSDYGLDKPGLQEALGYARAGERLPRVILPADIPQARIGPAVPSGAEPPPPFIPETPPDVPRSAPPVAESAAVVEEDKMRISPRPETDKIDVPSTVDQAAAEQERTLEALGLTEPQQKILAEKVLPVIENLSAKEATDALVKEIYGAEMQQLLRKQGGTTFEELVERLFPETGIWGDARSFIYGGSKGEFLYESNPRFWGRGIDSIASQAQSLFERIDTLRRYTGIEPSPKQSVYSYLLRLVEHAQQKQ